MSTDLTVTTINDEPRIPDTDLAEALGYARPTDIRYLIKRHDASLRELDLLHTVCESTGGRPATVFYLTKKQALFIITEAQVHFVIARSRTKRADVELVFVAQVFTEFRNGNLVAKDDDTQARLDAAEEARRERLAELQSDKEARHRAFKIMNSGRSSRPRRLPRY